jgi:hypothetical protein
MSGWNPYFVAYARAGGLTPTGALARDRKRHPGGPMVGFIGWMSARWGEWDALHGHKRDHFRGPEEHKAFEQWLRGRK